MRYTVRNICDWEYVDPLELHFVVAFGDVNENMATDVTRVNAEQVDPAPEDSRFDINGSDADDVTDVAITLAERGNAAPTKPSDIKSIT